MMPVLQPAVVDNRPDLGLRARTLKRADAVRWASIVKTTMTPEPTDKLDAATIVAVNGPADDTLLNERIVRRHIDGPVRACLSRMLGNGHVRF